MNMDYKKYIVYVPYNPQQKGGEIMKLLWFSRHAMTQDQLNALVAKHGQLDIRQVDKTITSARELQDDIEWADIVAIVAPIGLQAEFLRLAGEKPVIIAVNDRVLIDDGTGESKVEFRFVKWERLLKIEVVKEDYCC